MIAWCRIHGTPLRQFYLDARALPLLDQKQAAHAILTDAGTLKTTTGTENASITLTLRNAFNETLKLYANPPIGALCEIFGDGNVLFEGTVTQVSLSNANGQIEVQA